MQLSQNCPYTIYKAPFNGSTTNVDKEANSGVGVMELDNWKKFDEITTATWFTMAWVSTWAGSEKKNIQHVFINLPSEQER